MKTQTISTIIQWVIMVAIIFIAYWFGWREHKIHFEGTLNGAEVILFALSIAFTFVEVFKIFPCLKCVTGWMALILAWTCNTPFAWAYLFVGLFAGAVFSSIKTRWL